MRIVGKQNRSEIELDPGEALRRGAILDAMLFAARPPWQRGVFRGSHAYFNQMDAARAVEAAKRINAE